MRVEVVRSARRRKTVQAREVDGVIRLLIPASMSAAEEARWVGEMSRRLARRRSAERIDLAQRAEMLAARHRLPHPTSIRWVDNQEWRWGSCTPSQGTIRISSRLAGFPDWVVDYVIVHELAHLAEAGHGRRFWALVGRYPRAERARGYLMAKGIDDEGRDGPGEGQGQEPAALDLPAAAAAPRRRAVSPRVAAAGEPRSPAATGLQTLW